MLEMITKAENVFLDFPSERNWKKKKKKKLYVQQG